MAKHDCEHFICRTTVRLFVSRVRSILRMRQEFWLDDHVEDQLCVWVSLLDFWKEGSQMQYKPSHIPLCHLTPNKAKQFSAFWATVFNDFDTCLVQENAAKLCANMGSHSEKMHSGEEASVSVG